MHRFSHTVKGVALDRWKRLHATFYHLADKNNRVYLCGCAKSFRVEFKDGEYRYCHCPSKRNYKYKKWAQKYKYRKWAQ